MEHLYGLHSSSSTQDYPYFPDVDDLLDFSNDQIFSSSSSTSTTSSTDSQPSYYAAPPPPPALFNPTTSTTTSTTTDFPNDLCLQSEDVAELEWLSRFVDDSFTEFPAPVELSESISNPNNNNSHPNLTYIKPETIRRCTHCASEKTPQWRTGPLGPKTLCNACGVRYKSGRLVPEYRPAASPTFVLTQHSNSHRKVMELRRKKEASSQQLRPDVEEQHQGRFYLHPERV